MGEEWLRRSGVIRSIHLPPRFLTVPPAFHRQHKLVSDFADELRTWVHPGMRGRREPRLKQMDDSHRLHVFVLGILSQVVGICVLRS